MVDHPAAVAGRQDHRRPDPEIHREAPPAAGRIVGGHPRTPTDASQPGRTAPRLSTRSWDGWPRVPGGDVHYAHTPGGPTTKAAGLAQQGSRRSHDTVQSPLRLARRAVTISASVRRHACHGAHARLAGGEERPGRPSAGGYQDPSGACCGCEGRSGGEMAGMLCRGRSGSGLTRRQSRRVLGRWRRIQGWGASCPVAVGGSLAAVPRRPAVGRRPPVGLSAVYPAPAGRSAQ